jgi:hypothetical protein
VEFQRLGEELRKLSGSSFLGAAWSYGDELHVDTSGEGHRTPGRHGQDWTVGTRASRWLLLSPTRLVAHDRDAKDPGLTAFKPLEGSTIRSAEARFEDYALTLTFSNDYRFVILTTKRRRIALPDLALWCIYTPYGTVVEAQENGDVDFIPGDVVDDVAYRREARGR